MKTQFIKFRSGDYNLFAVVNMHTDLNQIENDYAFANPKLKERLNSTDKVTYNLRQYTIKPYFIGFQPIKANLCIVNISEKVESGLSRLSYLLTLNKIEHGDTILYYKPNPFKVLVAYVYDWEIEPIKNKLVCFNTDSLNIEWFSNGDRLNKEKFDALITNYVLRGKDGTNKHE